MQVEDAMSWRSASRQDAFEVSKAIAAIGYLVERTKETMYPIMKMMYLADKLHLERFGRFIAGDNYTAMEKGPVPSHAYNMIKKVRGDVNCRDGSDLAIACDFLIYRDDHRIDLKREPDYDELSASDIECLQEVVDIYQRVGKWAVRDMSHDDAWTEAWRSRSRFFFQKSVTMNLEAIAAQFDDADALSAHLADPNPGEATAPTRKELDTAANW
jgi:uncharacterized phage-associated protein